MSVPQKVGQRGAEERAELGGVNISPDGLTLLGSRKNSIPTKMEKPSEQKESIQHNGCIFVLSVGSPTILDRKK